MGNENINVDLNEQLIRSQTPAVLSLKVGSLGEGLERIQSTISTATIAIKKKVSRIFYGKTNQGAVADKKKGAKKIFQNPLDLGLLKLLNIIATIDFCAIFSFAANQIPDNLQKFDPNKQPDDKSPLGKSKWQIQKYAYDIQKYIDNFMATYAGSQTAIDFIPFNEDTKRELNNLIAQITSLLEDLTNPNEDASLENPAFVEAFPQATILNNFIRNAIGSLNRKLDLRQINNAEFQNAINTINKVRQTCITVQAINDPKTVLQQLDTFTKGSISEAIRQLDQLINPSRIVGFLKSLIGTIKIIVKTVSTIANIIGLLQTVIKVSLLLLKIFYKLRLFFFGIPIPQVVNTVGGQNTISATLQDVVVNKGLVYFLRRLLQINELLGIIRSLCIYMVNNINLLIPKLQLITRNLNSCNDCPGDLKNDFNNTTEELINSRDFLQSFIDKFNNANEVKDRTYGNYTIQIITEETTDTALSIKRRYGIALDSNKIKTVQSTATFASDDSIIVNEVKLLLSAGGFVNKSLSGMSSSDMAIVLESINYLGDETITIDDIDLSSIADTTIDPSDNENEEVGLGLNAFVNNLPGGKKLKKRIRKSMADHARSLATDLKTTDPNSTYTKKIVSEQNSQANKLDIDNLKNEIVGWKKEIASAALLGPIAAAVVIKDRSEKIKSAERKIIELQRQS
jgi:hypothetical protein